MLHKYGRVCILTPEQILATAWPCPRAPSNIWWRELYIFIIFYCCSIAVVAIPLHGFPLLPCPVQPPTHSHSILTFKRAHALPFFFFWTVQSRKDLDVRCQQWRKAGQPQKCWSGGPDPNCAPQINPFYLAENAVGLQIILVCVKL